MPHVSVRHAEPDDCEAIHRIRSGPRATAGTLQLPFQSVEYVRRCFSESPEGLHLALGVLWLAWLTRGFRKAPPQMSLDEAATTSERG